MRFPFDLFSENGYNVRNRESPIGRKKFNGGRKRYSMNSSELKAQIYAYLGFHGVARDGETEELITQCLAELDGLHRFRYLYEIFGDFPAFVQKEPYRSYLFGCTGVILSVMTLGAEVDRRIKYLGRTELARSLVMDACASALLEKLSDDYEGALGNSLGKPLTYRFCPGYGGSDVSDIRFIFEALKPEKIGIALLESNFMLPSKSMAGVIGVGKNTTKSCGDCFALPHCEYRREGRRCFCSTSSEKR